MSATFGGESASYPSALIWHSVLIESDYETQDIHLPQDSGEQSGGSPSQHVRPESGASGIPVRYPVGRRRPEPFLIPNRSVVDSSHSVSYRAVFTMITRYKMP